MSLSRSKIAFLLMIMALFVAACGGGNATPTRPAATSVPVEIETEEAAAEPTESADEPTEEAAADETEEAAEPTEEATTEVAMADMTEEATVEAAGEEATLEATEEMAEPTEEATEVALEPTTEATDEAVIEVTLEVTDEATDEPSVEATDEAVAGDLTATTVQLQGEAQAGYPAFYVAADQGYYEDAGLDVSFEANSDEVALADDATFGVADAYSVLVAQQGGDDVVIIGFLPRAAMPDMSAMAEMTVEPMDAEATVEAGAVDVPSFASGYLAIYTSSEWLSEEGSEEVAVDFLQATIMGWDYCAENSDECLDIVTEAVPDAPQVDLDMIEAGAGVTLSDMADTIQTQWETLVGGALAADVITAEPAEDAVRIDLFEEAFTSLDEAESDDSGSTEEMEATAEADEEMDESTEDMTEATAEATP